tara:strand:- start:180 stop:1070 length:891 start_codon:yes stop_codon:yes gene_type:complete
MKTKNIILVIGGAGFVGSNLIEFLLKKTNFNIISYDNYSTGKINNHIKNKRIKYLKAHTKDISKKISKFKNKIETTFHFGEFSRIYQSFLKMDECIESNTIGTHAVFKFCMTNKIRLIYSATSASLGNRGIDKDLSPYAFTKAKNLEMLENLKKWFGFKYEIIYFYNLYGPRQISRGEMATVIGIFEKLFEQKKPITVVKPGTQSRRFTHIDDAIKVCFEAWKKKKSLHYSISHKKVYTLLSVAKLFSSKIKLLPKRPGERYASALTNMNLSNKVHKRFGKINLKDYIKEFKKKNI